jgi:hypothetical protein
MKRSSTILGYLGLGVVLAAFSPTISAATEIDGGRALRLLKNNWNTFVFADTDTCRLLCPAGDNEGTLVPLGSGGYRTVDFNGDGRVVLSDLAHFALNFPPNPLVDLCTDLLCDGTMALTDLAVFALHFTHIGPVPTWCALAAASAGAPPDLSTPAVTRPAGDGRAAASDTDHH